MHSEKLIHNRKRAQQEQHWVSVYWLCLLLKSVSRIIVTVLAYFVSLSFWAQSQCSLVKRQSVWQQICMLYAWCLCDFDIYLAYGLLCCSSPNLVQFSIFQVLSFFTKNNISCKETTMYFLKLHLHLDISQPEIHENIIIECRQVQRNIKELY